VAIITLEDAKAHLNITEDFDDALITAKVAAAQACVESFVGKLDDVAAFPDGAPEPLKEAVRQLTAHLYESRGDGPSATIPLGVFGLVGPYRAWTF
jgi:uncharacterized phage protein (predicted DNA packaging)